MDDGDPGGEPEERPHRPPGVGLLGPRGDPGEGDQADALGDEVRQVRERQADDVEAQRRGREEQRQHHLVGAQDVDRREAGQEAAQPEGGQEPPVDRRAGRPRGEQRIPLIRQAVPLIENAARSTATIGTMASLSGHEQRGDADRVQRPGQQAQPVEEPQPEVALQQRRGRTAGRASPGQAPSVSQPAVANLVQGLRAGSAAATGPGARSGAPPGEARSQRPSRASALDDGGVAGDASR